MTEVKHNQRRIHSATWNYFKRLSPGVARCDLCRKQLSFKTSITNLKRHLLLKHKVNLGFKIEKSLDEQIDVRKLICLVKQHPCLWDIHCPYFGNSQKNIESWNSIAGILWPEENSTVAVQKLLERFSALKELFFEDKLRLANGSNIPTSIYYEDLQFLDFSHETINISSESSVEEAPEQTHMDVFEINEVDIKDEPFDECNSGNEYRDVLQPETAKARCNGDNNASSTRLRNGNKYIVVSTGGGTPEEVKTFDQSEQMTPQYNLQLNNADKDVLFLLSLSEEMKSVPKELKTTFKSELMMTISSLVQKYNRPGGHNHLSFDD